MSDDEILDARDVAKRLKVSYRTVVRMADKGELPSFRVGDLWRFRTNDIEKYIERQIKSRSKEQGSSD